MTEYVYIERCSAADAVYHRYKLDGDNWNTADDASYKEWVCDWYERMACGKKITVCATLIQRDRADLFARPCKKCFP